MNFPEIRPEDVFNWLMGVGQLIPGAYIVFGIFIVIAILGGVRYNKNVERKNARVEAERIAAEQASGTQYYDQSPGPYRD
jgi:hypothetical protein